MLKTALIAAVLCALSSNAEARPRHHFVDVNNMVGCTDPVMRPCDQLPILGGGNQRKANKNGHFLADSGQKEITHQNTVVGSRPAGCPRRYCGCGASLYVFGRIIPTLNLARNWLRFPRVGPASGMAAARSGHVFILKEHIKGLVWLVHDSNSGGGRTRLHARSIAGFAIVNPHGSRLALQ